ncbi:NAD(P)H-hydrate dehydratase [Ethanoligenens sp.]|uniref:NAD(P)H-hydrate dehydratase n=1 Tax=Ethanoligenens sp. TaxID=2099655 RepID=UPI0039E8D124
MKIIGVAQMKAAEQYAIDHGVSALQLMENAGAAAAQTIRDAIPRQSTCTVVCGAGNNGGDGFVVARLLHEAGHAVSVVLAAGEPRTEEAAAMYKRLPDKEVRIYRYAENPVRCRQLFTFSAVLVDAVFGTGFHGEVDADTAELFESMNESGHPIFALDMPSGANAGDGSAAVHAVRAAATITFAAAKSGQLKSPASEHCGKLLLAEIGIPDEGLPKNATELLDRTFLERVLPVRASDSNKGSYGRLLCLCGSKRYPGAAYMSGMAAARCGAGLVTVGAPEVLWSVLASRFSEVMILPLPQTEAGGLSVVALDDILQFAARCSCVLIGCGISPESETAALVRTLLQRLRGTVVLDADGINACAGHIDILRASKADLVLTPHPGEMGRLCGKTAADVQADRENCATAFAREAGVTLVLKGAGTLIAAPDGRLFQNNTGNPGLAKGGSGDILAGMVAGLAAQGIDPTLAACAAVHIHGLAADRCAEKHAQYAMLPTDLFSEIPQIFRELSR